MPRPRLTPEQLEQAIDLQRKCLTHEAIAAKLGVHRHTISRALSRYNKKVAARLESRKVAERARQVAQLHWVAEQAAHGWQRSLEDAVTIKTGGGPNSDGFETTTKGQSGNPAMLAQIRESLAEIRSILGLDRPDPTPPDDDSESDEIPLWDERLMGEGGHPAHEGAPDPDPPA